MPPGGPPARDVDLIINNDLPAADPEPDVPVEDNQPHP